MDTHKNIESSKNENIITGCGMDSVVYLMNAIERNTYHANIIIDIQSNQPLFISRNIYDICGVDYDPDIDSGCDKILGLIPPEEKVKINELSRNALMIVDKANTAEKCCFTLSVNIQIYKKDRKRTVNLKITPINLSKDGKIRHILCSVSLSSNNRPGSPMLKKMDNGTCYQYCKECHKWKKATSLQLTYNEKEVLSLSSHGLTAKEIANAMHKSLDTIKTYKRSIFVKLDVKNISSAIICAQNNKLI